MLPVGVPVGTPGAAVLTTDLESKFAVGLGLEFAGGGTVDGSCVCGAELAMDEASVALKVGGTVDDAPELIAVGAAAVAAGRRIAPMNINAPRFRLHPMRQ
ncbi:MAG: hypothetical protein ABSG02_19730 [Terriglobales bacterium]